MFRQFFSGLESPALPLAAMFFFIIVFVVVVARVLSRGRAGEDRAAAHLPLDDDEPSSAPEVKP